MQIAIQVCQIEYGVDGRRGALWFCAALLHERMILFLSFSSYCIGES